MFFDRWAQRSYVTWPAYDSTQLYDRTSLAGLESDIQTVSETWLAHGMHNSVEEFVCALPLAYFRFSAHDRYVGRQATGWTPSFGYSYSRNSTGGSTKQRLSTISGPVLNSASNWGWRRSRTSRHCGEAATSGSPLTSERQWRQPLE